MSSFVATPPRVRSPFKTKNGTLPLGFQPPRPSNDNKPSHDNPYLRRLKAFRKELLENPPFTLVSLFCGGGGLDLGLSFAGFGTRVASDVAPAFVDSVVTNLPHAKACKEDALELTKEKLCKLAETTKIDLVAAGPPCQSFSILGQRGALADPRGKLHDQMVLLIARTCQAKGASVFEDPGSVDLLVQHQQLEFIIEVKSVTPRNFIARLRYALGQVLHYDFLRAGATQLPRRKVVAFAAQIPTNSWSVDLVNNHLDMDLLTLQSGRLLVHSPSQAAIQLFG